MRSLQFNVFETEPNERAIAGDEWLLVCPIVDGIQRSSICKVGREWRQFAFFLCHLLNQFAGRALMEMGSACTPERTLDLMCLGRPDSELMKSAEGVGDAEPN